MRRWLIRHEQNELPFVVASGSIAGGYFGQTDGARQYTVSAADKSQATQVVQLDGEAHRVSVLRKAGQLFVHVDGFFYRFQATQLRGESAAGSAALEIRSEIPGRIIKVLVQPGDLVTQGQAVVVQEAMKMEITLVAGSNRRIAEVLVEAGAQVVADEVLIRFAGENES